MQVSQGLEKAANFALRQFRFDFQCRQSCVKGADSPPFHGFSSQSLDTMSIELRKESVSVITSQMW